MSYFTVRAEGSPTALHTTDNATSLDEAEATAAAVGLARTAQVGQNYVLRKHTGRKSIHVATIVPGGEVVHPRVPVAWRVDDEPDAGAAPLVRFCEHRPYPGAGYWCLLDAGHYPDTPHSDLTLLWDDQGRPVNLDGSRV